MLLIASAKILASFSSRILVIKTSEAVFRTSSSLFAGTLMLSSVEEVTFLPVLASAGFGADLTPPFSAGGDGWVSG